MFQERLQRVGTKCSQSLEDQIRVFILDCGGFKRLKKLEGGTLGSRDRDDEFPLTMLVEPEIVGQEVSASAFPLQPIWRTIAGLVSGIAVVKARPTCAH